MTPEELLRLPSTIDLPTAARAIGIGRNQAYDLAARGEFPCRILKLGSRYKVLTADLLRVLGVERPQPSQASTTEADLTASPMRRFAKGRICAGIYRGAEAEALAASRLGHSSEPDFPLASGWAWRLVTEKIGAEQWRVDWRAEFGADDRGTK